MVFIEIIRKYFNLPNCRECETLRHQLEIANDEKRKLLNAVIELTENRQTQIVTSEGTTEVPKPIGRVFVPWAQRAIMLEAEDRVRAEKLKQKQEELAKMDAARSTDDLEKELLDASNDPKTGSNAA